MEEKTLPSFHFISADPNEEFILGDHIDRLGESQYGRNSDVNGALSLQKMSSEELEVNTRCSNDNLMNLFVDEITDADAKVVQLLNSIKKEENVWDNGYLENVLDKSSISCDTKDIKDWNIKTGDGGVLYNLIRTVNDLENKDSKDCIQAGLSTTTHISQPTTSKSASPSDSMRESVIVKNVSLSNQSWSRIDSKSNYKHPSKCVKSIHDATLQSEVIYIVDDSSSDDGCEPGSLTSDDHSIIQMGHYPPETPIDATVETDDPKVTSYSSNSKGTETNTSSNIDNEGDKQGTKDCHEDTEVYNLTRHSNELDLIEMYSSSDSDSEEDTSIRRKCQNNKHTQMVQWSYANLISMAILATSKKHITTSGILKYISTYFPEVCQKKLYWDISIMEYLNKSKYFVKHSDQNPNSTKNWTFRPSTEEKVTRQLKEKAYKILMQHQKTAV